MSTNSALTIQQRDGETIKVGPIPSTEGGWYDATDHAARLVIKASRYDADATGTTIVGNLSGDTTDGFCATFAVPTSITATAGAKWMHAWVTPPGGDPQTIRYCSLVVDPT